MLTLRPGSELELGSHRSGWQNGACASLCPAQGMAWQELAWGPAFGQASRHYSRGAGSSAPGKPSACPLLEADRACPAEPGGSQGEQLAALRLALSQGAAVLPSGAGRGAHRQVVGCAGLSNRREEDGHAFFADTCFHPICCRAEELCLRSNSAGK